MRVTSTLPFVLASQTGTVLGWGHKNWNWFDHSHQVVPHWKWPNPYPSDGTDPMGFEVPCKVISTVHATQYTLSELRQTTWSFVVDHFGWEHGARRYPGSWDGVDQGGDKRDIIMMEYRDVPEAVQAWIEEHRNDENPGKKWLFQLFDKNRGYPPTAAPPEDRVLFFAPAAMYEILPLWVAKGSNCEADMMDLSKYGPAAKHEGVVAYPERHSKPDSHHDIEIRIRAETTMETPDTMHWRIMWEKAHANMRREERRQKRKERESAKQGVFRERRIKDEL